MAADVEVDLDHPHLTLIGLLVETHAGLTRILGNRLECESHLSVQWFEVLLRLARTPGERLRMSDLAAQTTLTTSGLTRAVDRLEAAGLVRRVACAEDRRVAYAELTDEGRSRIRAAVPMQLAGVRELLDDRFSPAELDQLAGLVRRLRDAVHPGATRNDAPPG